MNNKLISVILTGGKSSRMNYLNKSFLKINDQFFIEKIISSLKDKTETICINANNDIEIYKGFKLTIIQDVLKAKQNSRLCIPSKPIGMLVIEFNARGSQIFTPHVTC